MFVTYLIGAGVAPFLNTVAGIMALYLLMSGWFAGRVRELRAGPFELAGLVLALSVTAAGIVFAHLGSSDPTGTVDGAPLQSFFTFIVAGAAASLGELHVILRREIVGRGACRAAPLGHRFSWFVAAGSFFLGQQPIMPQRIQGSALLFVCALTPFAAMMF